MSFVRLGFSLEAWFTEALQGDEPEMFVVNRAGAAAELALILSWWAPPCRWRLARVPMDS